MKLGLSTYSLSKAIQRKEMTVLDVLEWITENGGQNVEIVPIAYDLEENEELVEKIIDKIKSSKLKVSNYAIKANFVDLNTKELEKEIERVKKNVDIAYKLGTKNMRHDVAWRSVDEIDIIQFEKDLSTMVYASQQIADYAKQFGITTSVENHGYFVQASDRILRLVNEVNRENFKVTLDIGNFLCVDEDPLVAVEKLIPYSSMIHLKDFYVRTRHNNPGEGWINSSSGKYLRGSILGQGDMNIPSILKVIKEAGYKGDFSIEFEGMENCKQGSKIGMENARRIWEKL